MSLGAFSVSLAVRDMEASRQFYRKLGFREFAGNANDKWMIMRCGGSVIGLFEGMFQDNILTFNPGWDQDASTLQEFENVRHIQQRLRAEGIEPLEPIDENGTGPASFIITDPDGNSILFDQHV